jgi:hypothetical protein
MKERGEVQKLSGNNPSHVYTQEYKNKNPL